MFYIGIERILKAQATAQSSLSLTVDNTPLRSLIGTPNNGPVAEPTQWMDYFPYLTAETSLLISSLIINDAVTMPFIDTDWSNEAQIQLQDLFKDIGASSWSDGNASEWFRF
jgi:hypothetical protein